VFVLLLCWVFTIVTETTTMPVLRLIKTVDENNNNIDLSINIIFYYTVLNITLFIQYSVLRYSIIVQYNNHTETFVTRILLKIGQFNNIGCCF